MSVAYLSLVVRHPRHFAKHWLDEFCRWLAFKLPRRIVYHAYIRLHAAATGEPKHASKHPDDVRWTDALDAWEGRP